MSNEDTLQALIVPLRTMNLVLPQLLAAEIIPYPHVSEVGESPWFHGMFEWRDQSLALLSMDRFCHPDDDGQTALRTRRVAVLNAIGDSSTVEHYGIEIGSIPHPVQLQPQDVKPAAVETPCDLIAFHVHAAGVKAVIPDFSALESRVEQVLAQLERAG